MAAQEKLSGLRNLIAQYGFFAYIRQWAIYAVIKPKSGNVKYIGYNFDKGKFGLSTDIAQWEKDGDFWLPISEFSDVNITIKIPYSLLKKYKKT